MGADGSVRWAARPRHRGFSCQIISQKSLSAYPPFLQNVPELQKERAAVIPAELRIWNETRQASRLFHLFFNLIY